MHFRHTTRTVSGFTIHTLANDALSLTIAPELGGRIISLKDRISGREWLDGWSPVSKRRIWHPSDPANFETGPGAGADECLPTVLPCKLGRRSLQDHGDLWNQAPELRIDPKDGLSCRWKLKSLPLAFERRASIRKASVLLDYRIENLAPECAPFLYAWHPLFTWKPGDQIRFDPSVKNCLTSGGETLPWPETTPGTDLSKALFSKNTVPAAKVFIAPKSAGAAEIHARNGSKLKLTWPLAQLPFAGIWITRGYWKGLHHWAIEPTNAPVDCLSDILTGTKPSPTLLGPGEVRNWRVTISV